MNIKCFDGTDNGSVQNREKSNPMVKRKREESSRAKEEKKIFFLAHHKNITYIYRNMYKYEIYTIFFITVKYVT